MKILPFIISAAISFQLLTGANAGAEGGSLVVLGDSIASGYGLEGYSAGDNYSAPDSFGNRLGALYPVYQNFAQDGLTTDGLLEKLEDEQVSAALSGADTVVISIGGNDFLMPMITAAITAAAESPDLMEKLKNSGGEDFTEYLDVMRDFTEKMISAAEAVDTTAVGDNLDVILGSVRELSPDCEIIILTVYDPFEGVTGMELFDVTAREKLALLNAEITAAAEKYGAQTADVYSAFKGNAEGLTNILSMDIHPNKDGHGEIYSLLTGIADIPAAQTSAKPSPDTGAEGMALLCGIAVISGGIAVMLRKRR